MENCGGNSANLSANTGEIATDSKLLSNSVSHSSRFRNNEQCSSSGYHKHDIESTRGVFTKVVCVKQFESTWSLLAAKQETRSEHSGEHLDERMLFRGCREDGCMLMASWEVFLCSHVLIVVRLVDEQCLPWYGLSLIKVLLFGVFLLG